METSRLKLTMAVDDLALGTRFQLIPLHKVVVRIKGGTMYTTLSNLEKGWNRYIVVIIIK